MADESDDKTEEATAQRREEFRKKGQVAQTRELATFMMLLACSITLWVMGSFLLKEASDLFTYVLSHSLADLSKKEDYYPIFMVTVQKAALLAGPLMIIFAVLGIASSVVQVGFLYNEEALNLDLEKINPISGFKKIFSLRSLVEGIKAVLKVSIVALIAYVVVKEEFLSSASLVDFSIEEMLSFLSNTSSRLLIGVTIFIGILAAADYGYQRWELEKSMRMSKQEIKEENKNREGDPLIKAKIKRIQREMANKRMMQDVPKADVIITNPTHIAVAVKYEIGSPAPKILAMGADAVAEKIREIAKQNKIPIIENKPLARTMYQTLKVGMFVPRELFQAVAEVLAYVYKLRRKRSF